MVLNERRQMDANAAINLACVRGVIGVAVLFAAGSVALPLMDKPVPEVMGTVIIAITSGLIGYLSREPKHATSTVPVEHANTVNVEATPKNEETRQNGT